MKKEFFFIKITIIILLSIFQTSLAGDQNSSGKNGQNYKSVNGDVNNNRIATLKVVNVNNKIKISPTKNISNRTINKINHLIIPKNLGFSEILHNEKTNNYYIKNHKYNTTNKLLVSKTNFSYINSSKTNINNSRNIETTDNSRRIESVNNGTITGGNVGNNVGRDISYIGNQSNSGENGQIIGVVKGDVNNNTAPKVDIKKMRTVLQSVVKKECLNISKKTKTIFKGTSWHGCDVHIANIPRIGLSVQDLMTISQAEGMANYDEVVDTISARSLVKGNLDVIKDNIRLTTVWVDNESASFYVGRLNTFCKISGVKITMPKCSREP